MEKLLAISGGIYRRDDGSFFIRPTINGSRTWRKLAATTKKDALQEGAILLGDQKRARIGLATDPFKAKVSNVADLAAQYIAAGAPSRRQHKREAKGMLVEQRNLQWLVRFFGAMAPGDVRMPTLREYAAWRLRRITKGTGHRTVDVELATLSNLLNYAVETGLIDYNCTLNRPRNVKAADIRHCREVMPANADELHAIAREMFRQPKSQAVAWQMLFEALTGCRTNEILKLKTNGQDRNTPGFIEGRYLYVQRSKKGVFPFVEIHPALAEAIAAHKVWLADRFPGSEYWFPGQTGILPLTKDSLTHRLGKTCAKLGIPHRTSHGMRAFFVTVQRSNGLSNERVAALIGDKTSALIESTYGALPEVWAGGDPLTFLPSTTEPAWAPWVPARSPIVVQFPTAETHAPERAEIATH